MIYDALRSRRQIANDVKALELSLLCMEESDKDRCVSGLAALARLRRRTEFLHCTAVAADKSLKSRDGGALRSALHVLGEDVTK